MSIVETPLVRPDAAGARYLLLMKLIPHDSFAPVDGSTEQ